MLKKMVQKYLLELISTSEVLEQIVIGLIGTERFYRVIDDAAANSVTSKVVKAIIEDEVDKAVGEGLSRVVIMVQDHDLLVIPSNGLSATDFTNLTSMLPKGKEIGIVAADDVKILRLT